MLVCQTEWFTLENPIMEYCNDGGKWQPEYYQDNSDNDICCIDIFDYYEHISICLYFPKRIRFSVYDNPQKDCIQIKKPSDCYINETIHILVGSIFKKVDICPFMAEMIEEKLRLDKIYYVGIECEW